MPPLPLFVFGTLRRGECNHHFLSGQYDRLRPARLSGFAAVAPLMIARESGSVVMGELYDLAPASYSRSLQGCDRLEEIPVGDTIGREYRRIPVRVQTDGGEVIAWAYVRPDVEPEEDLRNLLNAEMERLKRLTVNALANPTSSS